MTYTLVRLLAGCLVTVTALVGTTAATPATAATSGDKPAGATSPATSPRHDTNARPGLSVGGPRLATPGVVVSPAAGVPRLPRADARAFVVADLESGEVLAAKAAHQRLRPASTLKVLTALAALPHVDLSDTYVATFKDANIIGAKVGLYPGGRYTVDQLLRTMIIASGNDAAHALATAAGGRHSTIRRMNALAKDLQAHDTTARNVTGLDRKGQFTSAYDLALFGRAAMAEPRLRRYASMVNTTLPDRQSERARKRGGQRKTPTYEVWTINRLLLNYRGAIGLKTGWTTLAQGTYIGVAKRRGHTLLVSVMGSRGNSWEAAATLLDWGFQAVGKASPVGMLVEPAKATPVPTARPTPAGGGVSASGDGRPTAAERGRDPGGQVLTWPLVLLVGVVLPIVVLRTRARRRQAEATR